MPGVIDKADPGIQVPQFGQRGCQPVDVGPGTQDRSVIVKGLDEAGAVLKLIRHPVEAVDLLQSGAVGFIAELIPQKRLKCLSGLKVGGAADPGVTFRKIGIEPDDIRKGTDIEIKLIVDPDDVSVMICRIRQCRHKTDLGIVIEQLRQIIVDALQILPDLSIIKCKCVPGFAEDTAPLRIGKHGGVERKSDHLDAQKHIEDGIEPFTKRIGFTGHFSLPRKPIITQTFQ